MKKKYKVARKKRNKFFLRRKNIKVESVKSKNKKINRVLQIVPSSFDKYEFTHKKKEVIIKNKLL